MAIFLAKESSNISLLDILENIEKISENNNLYWVFDKRFDESGNFRCIHATISDIPLDKYSERKIPFWAFDEKFEHNNYINLDFYNSSENLFRLIMVEDYNLNEEILLKFSYHFIKAYKDIKLWTEFDWFYELDDLEKIIRNPFDNEWCYKNPKDSF
ncbi:hypothetical protein [Paenibacillus sp. TH7-28]